MVKESMDLLELLRKSGVDTVMPWDWHDFAYRSSGKGATFRVFLSRGVEARRRCWR